MTCLVSPSKPPRAPLWPHWTMHHAPKRPFHVSYPLLGAFSPQRSLWGTTSAPSSLYTSHPHSVHPPQTASLSLPLPTPFPAFSIRISVQFSRSVVSDCLRHHESQHTRPPYPSPTPGVHSDSRPSSQWCHPAISSFVVPFSSCPQSLLASGSFPMSRPFAWGGQSIGVSVLASVLPKKSQGWSPSEWTLQSKGLSRVFSNTTVQKHQFFGAQPSSQSNSHVYTWPQEKP